VEIKMVNPNELKPHPQNPRVHPDSALEKLGRSIEEFGWTSPILISADGFVLAGHARLKAALAAGIAEVPVIYLDLEGAKAEAYMIADNKLQEETSWDMPLLKDLLESLEGAAVDLELTGFGVDELLKILGAKAGLADDDEIPEQVETICKTGDLWQLGEHRLLCGDATKKEDVERLMGGEKCNLIWTDPPYGVHYGEKLEKANPIAHRVRDIENDNLSPDKLEQFLRDALSNAAIASVPGAAIYVACPAGTLLPFLIASFNGSGFDFRWQLIWLKDQIVLSRADYHFKHENILYGWKPDGAHYFTDDRKQTSVFECPRPKASPEHPTMKPVELIERMLVNSSIVGQVVLDLFGGSGSTLIACEKLVRRCYMLEIDCHYVDIIIQRWQNFTGKEAVKL
jgi:DNA modification methylase